MYNLGKTAYEIYMKEEKIYVLESKLCRKHEHAEWKDLDPAVQKIWNNVALEVIKQYIKDCPV